MCKQHIYYNFAACQKWPIRQSSSYSLFMKIYTQIEPNISYQIQTY